MRVIDSQNDRVLEETSIIEKPLTQINAPNTYDSALHPQLAPSTSPALSSHSNQHHKRLSLQLPSLIKGKTVDDGQVGSHNRNLGNSSAEFVQPSASMSSTHDCSDAIHFKNDQNIPSSHSLTQSPKSFSMSPQDSSHSYAPNATSKASIRKKWFKWSSKTGSKSDQPAQGLVVSSESVTSDIKKTANDISISHHHEVLSHMPFF